MSLPLSLLNLVRRLNSSEAAWRSADAFTPRIIALLLHTVALAGFGSSGYAVIAWVTSVFALSYALIPDPHSYILIRRHGAGATRLARLATPVIVLKGALSLGLSLISAYFLLAASLKESAGPNLGGYILAGALYSISEAWWSYVGVIGLAEEKLKKTAQLGMAARATGLALLGIASFAHVSSPALLSLIYCAPILGVTAFLMSWAWAPRRALIFYKFGVRRYALWSQGIGLSTGWLGQLVPIVAGLSTAIAPAEVGVLAYVTRVLGAAMTPLQVLQSVVIKLVAKHKDAHAPAVKRYDRWFKIATLVLMLGYSAGLVVGHYFYTVSLSLTAGLAIQGLGLFIVSWHRVALTSVMASHRARPLFLAGYLPVLVLSTALAWPVLQWGGILGLSVLSTVGWTYIAFSWKLPGVRSS